ncbi:hypothetical protein GH714_001572 [Hevea brasiliensis]|uniref:C2H2-type domain-containing protein n=1 Tax=Hevea brasiliensis TaxID=3981 RepID=A0A6A6LXV0_HEVBR|nr:hypothetical protein GH714_001572 [Hevea brasiliensis]
MAMVVDVDAKGELGFPYWTPVRRRLGPIPLFFCGNIERELLAKQVALDLTEDDKHQLQNLVDQDGRCALKFKNYKSRQQHLVDKHKFPSAFEFFKKAHPSKMARQKHQRRLAIRKREETSTKMEVEGETIDGLISAVSRLSTSDSPPSVSFGRRHTRGLMFVPRTVQRENSSHSGTKR